MKHTWTLQTLSWEAIVDQDSLGGQDVGRKNDTARVNQEGIDSFWPWADVVERFGIQNEELALHTDSLRHARLP